jgi:hypothetical protein
MPITWSIRLAYTAACLPVACIDAAPDSAVLTYTPVPGASAYALVSLRSGVVQFLGGNQTVAIDFMGDDPQGTPFACYVLAVLGPGNQVQGVSSPQCGQGMFGAPV